MKTFEVISCLNFKGISRIKFLKSGVFDVHFCRNTDVTDKPALGCVNCGSCAYFPNIEYFFEVITLKSELF